jgi:polar amino acid transport system substrate-binding protein/glutamate/aspartate transport system substrate-binding protein
LKKALLATAAAVWVLSFVVFASSPGYAESLEGTLKKIKGSKTLVVGYRADAWPFSFAPEPGKAEGYSVELCQRIAAGVQQQLGLDKLDIKYVEITTQNRIQAVFDGKVDIECGATTITLSRMEQVDFSSKIFVDGASVMARKKSGIRRLVDLSGKKVAVTLGTTTETALREAVDKQLLKVELVPVNDYAEGLAAVESGKADGLAGDRVILIGQLLKAKDPLEWALSEDQFSYEPYALMLKRGDWSFRLAANRVLARLYRSGEVAAIYKKWFGPLGDPPGVLVLMYVLNALPE